MESSSGCPKCTSIPPEMGGGEKGGEQTSEEEEVSEETEGGEKGREQRSEEVEEERGGRRVRCQRERGSELFLNVIYIEITYCWNYNVYVLKR